MGVFLWGSSHVFILLKITMVMVYSHENVSAQCSLRVHDRHVGHVVHTRLRYRSILISLIVYRLNNGESIYIYIYIYDGIEAPIGSNVVINVLLQDISLTFSLRSQNIHADIF